MKRKYLRSVLIMAVFAMIISLFAVCAFAGDYSDASVNSENAALLTENVSAKCTLKSGNNFMTAYKLTPKEDAQYIFFAAGSAKEVRGKLYEGVGNTDSLDNYIDFRYSDSDEPGYFYFTANLSKGEEYTYLVQSPVESENAVFDVGFVKADSGILMKSASEITLTEENKYYWFGVFGDETPDTDWIISDYSIVSSSLSISSGHYNVRYLEANKNGTATIKLVNNNTGDVLASAKITCTGVTEYYDLYVGGVQVNSKNASSITGKGISGKVSYDKSTNTLYLNNATLTTAIKSEGLIEPSDGSKESSTTKGSGSGYAQWGNFSGVINHHTADTLKINLTGTNKINNVTLAANEGGGSNYDASSFYSGIEGIDSCGSVEFVGTGKLTIDSSGIGTAVYSGKNVTVAEGASLEIKETNNNNANGIVAKGSVTANGNLNVSVSTSSFMVDGRKACVKGYGVKAEQFNVGSKGSAVLNASTNCEVTSYCVLLNSGGSVKISGSLNAKAVGGSGEKAGVAIAGNNGEASFKVSGSGKATLQGNEAAVDNISFVQPILLKAGSSASKAKTIPPATYKGETYVAVSAPSSCSGGHKLTKIAAKDSTVDEEGNIEYWLCSECGKLFSDSAGKKEISVSDTVIPRKPGQDTSLFLISPDSGAVYDVGDTINITAYSDIYVFTYISGTLIEGAPNRIYVKVLKDGKEVASDTLLYYKISERVSTSFKAESAGKYTIQISKSSGFETIRSVDIQVGKTDDDQQSEKSSSGGKGTDGTATGKGASASAADKTIRNLPSDKDPAGNKFAPLKLKSVKQTKTSITVKWTKVKGAKKYVIYGNKCGKTNKPKKLATVTGSTKTFKKVAGKKLKKGTYYKFIIVALDKNNKVVSTSKLIHVATKGGKAGNDKSVTVKKSVLTKAKKLKKGKTLNLNAKAVAQSKKLKVKKHVAVRYESTNKKIATVTSKGKVRAKKKGTCYIYAYAQNGVFKKIKIVVK